MIWLAMGLIIIGASLQASAYVLAHLIIGRIITGLGTGIDSSTVPMYQSELAKKEWRGRLISWEIFFIGIGIVLSYWVDYGFSYIDGDVAWRTPIALQLVFAIAVVFIVWGCPESPRWLVKKGRTQEAVEVLCHVFDMQPDDEYIRTEMEGIHAAVNMEKQEDRGGIFSCFKADALQTRWRIFLAWFGLFMNQWSGINLVGLQCLRYQKRSLTGSKVVYYMPLALQYSVGLPHTESLLIAGFVELMFPIGNLLPALALDRLGRRPTMMIGAACLSFCMMMITIVSAALHLG